MKVNSTFLAFAITLLVNFTLVPGRALDFGPGSNVTTVNDGVLVVRGGSGKGSGKGSGGASGSKPPKQKSKIKKGSKKAEADAELDAWGFDHGEHDERETVWPAAYEFLGPQHPEDPEQQQWHVGWIEPDNEHADQYAGKSDILKYSTNVPYNAFHTEEVFTTENQEKQPRDIPTNKRSLIVNRWISEGGDPMNLLQLSDGYVVNTEDKAAFKNVFAGRGIGIQPGKSIALYTDDPDWKVWDDGNNPFPLGYQKMPIDYPEMQSEVSYVMLSVDEYGKYHLVHYMEHVGELEKRLQARAAYFERWNITDPLLI